MAFSKIIYDGTTLMDVTDDTVTAASLQTGYQATGADGQKVQGTSTGSFEKIADTDLTVNTSSTSATTVGTIACGASAWTKDKILYVKVRDKAGKRNGRFLGSDTFFFNFQAANSGTTTVETGLRACHSVDSSGNYTIRTNGEAAGYGVFGATISSTGSLVIHARYQSSYSRTINGTYNVQVYLLDYAPATGNPYNFSF